METQNVQNIAEHNVIEQLEKTARELHAKREQLLRQYAIFCHRVTALPVLTGTLANQVEEGETYEILARGIKQVHRNISEVAVHAEQLCNLFGCCDDPPNRRLDSFHEGDDHEQHCAS